MADLKTFRTRDRADAFRRRQSKALGYPKRPRRVNGGKHSPAATAPTEHHTGLLRKSATEWAVPIDTATRERAGVRTRLAGREEALDVSHDVTAADDDATTWQPAPRLARERTDAEIMDAVEAEPEVRSR